MTVELTEGGDCVDVVAQEGHCSLTLKITGGTLRFSHASGTLTYTETAKPILAVDAFHPVYFTETGKITGKIQKTPRFDTRCDRRANRADTQQSRH